MPNAHGPLVNGAGVPSEDPTKVFTVTAQEGKSGAERSISYTNCRFIGHGSFGVVLSANLRAADGTLGEAIAIKKVLQDPMFMNRELKMMRIVSHPNLVELKSFFYADGDKKGEVYLNLVMEHLPVTLADASKHYTRQKQIMPTLEIKLYMYQLFRSLNYIHALSICHRDIKPHNVLVNPATGVLKLIDFGSAKVLAPGAKSVSYICSRYYRAPELIFGATVYTTMIDIWSTACVMGELMLGQLLFPGESGIDQLVEIIKVLGTPSKAQIITMNEHYKDHKFPQIKAHPLSKVFRPRTSPESIDLISHLLQYTPTARLSAVQAMCHPFFDELKVKGGKGDTMGLFGFTREELSTQPDLIPKLVPDFAREALQGQGLDLNSFSPLSFDAMRVSLD